MNNPATGTTVNVGVMRAGERSNIICPEAYAEIDLRAIDPEEMESAIEAMRQIAAALDGPGHHNRILGRSVLSAAACQAGQRAAVRADAGDRVHGWLRGARHRERRRLGRQPHRPDRPDH